jgi:rhodanese-related sulfurtransferase
VSAIDKLLEAARSRLDRPDARRAAEMVTRGAILVDTRPGWQRAEEGNLPGALLIERNHLEWRLDPTSDARIPEAVDHDLDGGFRAWKAAGLPVS